MKQINAFASERHYYERVRTVWDQLPKYLKGEFVVHPRLDGLGDRSQREPNQDGYLMVASHKDSLWAKNKFIYIEHGAGQSYSNSKDNFSNSFRPNMLCALIPGPYCAAKTQLANPGVPVISIGAAHLRDVKRTDPQKLAFAWHWRCSVCIETDTAFDQYQDEMILATRRWESIGHGHPRIIDELSMVYKMYGIETVYDSKQVLSHAGLLVADNTSLIYEAAVLDIPVILINKTDWRRDRNYGLRFWDLLPGPQVNHPSELIPEIEKHIELGTDEWQNKRLEISDQIYGLDPFGMLEQGVDVLCELVDNYARYNP